MIVLTLAEQQLDTLDRGEKLRRFDVFANRHQIRQFLIWDKYEHLTDEIEDLIDSARSSL